MTKILLVDDASYMRLLIKEMIKNENYEIVAEASSGEIAIEKYKQLHPDLVILDLLMPDMDGIEVLKLIKSIDDDAKILICTASEQYHHVQESIKFGAIGFLVKPFDKETLINKINEIIQ